MTIACCHPARPPARVYLCNPQISEGNLVVRRSQAAGSSKIPQPIKVLENGNHEPTALRLDGRWVEVESVDSRRETKEWVAGREQVVKRHYKVTIESGQPVAVFRNHVTGGWYREG